MYGNPLIVHCVCRIYIKHCLNGNLFEYINQNRKATALIKLIWF